MKLKLKTVLNIFLLLISIFLFVGIIKWGNYLIKTKKCRNIEGFDIDIGAPGTSHTVDLPINNPVSCENMCGPLARCSKTGEQCSTDVDCFGCQPKVSIPKNELIDIRGQNDAGKLTASFTPTYSNLTTDIGTQAKLYDKGENLDPPTYFKGVDQWTDSFKAGMELYNKKFNPSIGVLPFLPKYPMRTTLTGEFQDDGPLASNAYLSNK